MTALGQFLAAVSGMDGPVAPLLEPADYAWPETEAEATAERLVRFLTRDAVEHTAQAHAHRREHGIDETFEVHTVVASLGYNFAVALEALRQADADLAERIAAASWSSAEFGHTEANLTYLARAIGVPTEVTL